MIFQFIQGVYEKIYKSYLCRRYGFLSKGFSIKSHLTSAERFALFKISKRPGIQICLEIGAYLGASTYFISAGLADNKNCIGKVFCIDTWNNDAMSEGNWDTFTDFSRNTASFSKFIIPVRGFSSDVVMQVASQIKHLDLLFIDGDHSYEGVKADWEAYKHFLKPGSVIVFHDWGWAEGVKRVIEEDAKQVVNSFDSLPNMWWGVIKS